MPTHGAQQRALPDDLPSRALYAGQLLIGAVRDHDPKAVTNILRGTDRQGLLDLTVTLAALVPYDSSLRELLQWNDEQCYDTRGRKVRRLRPHGTHAAYARHKKRGDTPCDECVIGERTFQRARMRVRRAT